MLKPLAYLAVVLMVGFSLALAAEEKPAAPADKPAADKPAAPAVDKEGFRPLFNGKDLAGWKADDEAKTHWIIEDGVIKYDGKNKDLWTQDSFTDFVLKVDWRLMTQGGDSGIFLRGSSKCQCNIWCDKLGSGEVYGYRTDSKQPEEVRKACTPSKRADKPVKEWNSFVITMKGDRLTVVLNGEEVISNAQLPGAPPKGPIALQHHGTPLEFRNILIKELKEPAAEKPAEKEGAK
jgi:hypothetical protein